MSYFLRGLAKGLDDVGTAKLKAKMEADKKNAANLLKAEAAKEKRKQDMEDFKAKEKIKNDYILKKEERQQTALAEQQEEARKYKAAFDAAESRDEQINISQQAQIGLTDEGLRSMFTMSNLEKGDPVKAGEYSASKMIAEQKALSEALKKDPSLERTYALGQGVAPSALAPTKTMRTEMQQAIRAADSTYAQTEDLLKTVPDMGVYQDSINKGFTEEEAMKAAEAAGKPRLNKEVWGWMADQRSGFTTMVNNIGSLPAAEGLANLIEYVDNEVLETKLKLTPEQQAQYQEVATRLTALVGVANTIAQNGDKRMSEGDRFNAQEMLGTKKGFASQDFPKVVAAVETIQMLALKQKYMTEYGITEENVSSDPSKVPQTKEGLLAALEESRNPQKAQPTEEGKPEQEDVVIDYTEYFK